MKITIEVKELGDKSTLPPGADLASHENLMVEESKEVKIKVKAAEQKANTTAPAKSVADHSSAQ